MQGRANRHHELKRQGSLIRASLLLDSEGAQEVRVQEHAEERFQGEAGAWGHIQKIVV